MSGGPNFSKGVVTNGRIIGYTDSLYCFRLDW